MAEAHRFYLSGDYRGALGCLSSILQGPGRLARKAEAAYWAGFCHLKLGEFPAAQTRFKQAISELKLPHFLGPATAGLAESFMGQKNYSQAAACYQKALEQYPEFIEKEIAARRLAEAKSNSENAEHSK